jgi:hypothetical protein
MSFLLPKISITFTLCLLYFIHIFFFFSLLNVTSRMGKFSVFIIAASLAAAGLVGASPVNEAIGQAQAGELAWRIKEAGMLGDTKSITAACAGQSCQIAHLSGSTGQMPTINPAGSGAAGFSCIAKYSPETAKIAAKSMAGKPGPSNGGFGMLALG